MRTIIYLLILIAAMVMTGCETDPHVPLNKTAAQYYCIALDACSINPVVPTAEQCAGELMKQPTWDHMPDLIAQSVIDCSNGDLTFSAVTCESWSTCIDKVNATTF